MTETVSYGFFRLNGNPSRTFLLAVVKNGSDNATLHLQKDNVAFPKNAIKDTSSTPSLKIAAAGST
jgi:hypothetical protein